MENDTKLAIVIMTGIVTVIVTLIVSITVYNAHYNTLIRDMINKGADPIALNCLFEDTMGNSPTCILYVTKEE